MTIFALAQSIEVERNQLRKENERLTRERDNALSDWEQADTDTLRALHERNQAREANRELVKTMEKIADQKLTQEIEEWMQDGADYEYAYNKIVEEARAILAKQKL